jgi:energy-coupling factor transport system permease protein
VLFTHIGQTTLFLIPQSWFLIGGNITLESLVYGLINGMIIGTIYLAFNILNLSLSVRQLTHLIPVALRPIAMTVTITLTFFPSIQQRAREIKEAQMIRGNQMKKIRDWLPLLLPLLISSLENAVQLSESMTSRGFETQPDLKNTKLTLVSLIISTFSVFSAWILSLYNYPVYLTLPLYIFGGMVIFVTFISASKKSSITHYRKEVWTKKDVFASGIFLLSLIGLVILLQFGRLSSFSYSPYPTLRFPDFSITGIMLSVVPLLPIFLGKND